MGQVSFSAKGPDGSLRPSHPSSACWGFCWGNCSTTAASLGLWPVPC